MAKLLVQALTLAVIAGLTATAVPAQTPLKPEREIEAKGFKTSKKGELKAAYDLSGIACLPPSGSEKRACLVINDQDKFAQLATYEDGKLKAGEIVPLLMKSWKVRSWEANPRTSAVPGARQSSKIWTVRAWLIKRHISTLSALTDARANIERPFRPPSF